MSSSEKNIAEAPKPRRRPARADTPGRRLAIEAARIAQADNCEDILVLDLRGVSPVCDFFVIATGTSDRQMRAVADHIEAAARGMNERPFRVTGLNDGVWIILDYIDTVIHLFDSDHRRYYDLEMLWGDAPRVNWKPKAAKKTAAM